MIVFLFLNAGISIVFVAVSFTISGSLHGFSDVKADVKHQDSVFSSCAMNDRYSLNVMSSR